MATPYTFGFLDQLVRINFPQGADDFLGSIFTTEGFARSLDGTTWTTNEFPPGTTLVEGAAYGNNTWIVSGSIAGNATLFKSTDNAKTWKTVHFDTVSTHFHSIAYIRPDTEKPGIFLANGSSGNVVRSADLGATWTSAALGDFDGTLTGGQEIARVCAANNKFFLLTQGAFADTGDANAYSYTSVDGLSWSSRSQLFAATDPLDDRNSIGTSVAYDETAKKYVAAGAVVRAGIPGDITTGKTTLAVDSSSDGSSWAGGEAFDSTSEGLGSRFDVDTDTTHFTVAAGNGFVVSSGQFAPNPDAHTTLSATIKFTVIESADGVDWNRVPLPDSGGSISDGVDMSLVAYSRSLGIFAILGLCPPSFGSAGVWTSEDRTTWVKTTPDVLAATNVIINVPQFLTTGKLH